MINNVLFYCLIQMLSSTQHSVPLNAAQERAAEKVNDAVVSDNEFEEFLLNDESLDKEPENLRAKSWPGSYYARKVGAALFVRLLTLRQKLSIWWYRSDEK